MNYEEFYNNIDDLFYKYRFNKINKKDLYLSVDDIFEKCDVFEKELDEIKSELEDSNSDYYNLRDDYESLDRENACNVEKISELENKINKYEEIIKRFAPEELL